MTTFALIGAAMIAAALLWLVWPLLRSKSADDAPSGPRQRRIAAAALALIVPALAALMYAHLSDWDFKRAERQAVAGAETDRLLQQLEAKLAANPRDLEGWLLLGRSYIATGRFARGVEAFQHAYDVSNGESVDAVIGLGEALVLANAGSFSGRAGQLFDAALAKAPNHPKALWYGSMAALQAGELRKGRDRLQLLLAQNPPEQLRGMLERQIQDLNQQLGEPGEGASSPASAARETAASARAVRVSVAIAPQIQQQLSGALPMFILARDPAGGPPLAVQRLSSAAAPLTVELTERDAMTPTRTLASAARVQIVARISKSGAPQAQRGDFFGSADYDFTAAGAGVVNIVIDQVVQ